MESTSAFAIPEHVPAELVRDFDCLQPVVEGDLYDWWAQFRDGPEIFFTPHRGGHWVATRHEDIAHILENHALFSSREMTVPRGAHPIPLPPITYDPPLHTDFRRLLAPFFTPKSIGDLEIKARELSVRLIDEVVGKGRCEFVSELSLVMPIGIFLSLVDLPDSDRLELLSYAEKMVRGRTPEERGEGSILASRYLGAVFAKRREKPGNDMLSHILQGKIQNERPLTETELLGMGALLLAGGLDTVAGMMGFIMLHLARHPEHQALLAAQPEIMPQAIEELMRRHQISNVARIVVSDTVYKGVAMKEGDMVFTPTSLAGLDEKRYPDPMRVDFDRADNRSLVFGKGPHQCIGAFLARTELRVFFTEWLKRVPRFNVAPGETPVAVPGGANTMSYLPLVWDV